VTNLLKVTRATEKTHSQEIHQKMGTVNLEFASVNFAIK